MMMLASDFVQNKMKIAIAKTGLAIVALMFNPAYQSVSFVLLKHKTDSK